MLICFPLLSKRFFQKAIRVAPTTLKAVIKNNFPLIYIHTHLLIMIFYCVSLSVRTET